MKKLSISLALLAAVSLFVGGCKKDSGKTWYFTPSNTETEIQEAMILCADGDVIEFSAGLFTFTQTLSLDGKKRITIRGAGRDETTLDFGPQTAGAEGIYAANMEWFLMKDFTVLDTKGDGIKVKDSDGVTFKRIGAEYTGVADSTNGAYGIYPVTSHNVLVDDCYVTGASDAGIYVGQTQHVIVRNCYTEYNVLGIEIENCISSDVYDNSCHKNAGGMLITDLPNLGVIKNGSHCRVYNNDIGQNDQPNFAKVGNTVASVPVGTGIMVLAANDVEIFGNTIADNNIMSVGVVSYTTLTFLAGITLTDALYEPYSERVNIHDNIISRTNTFPAIGNTNSDLLIGLFSADISAIIWDHERSATYASDPSGSICIKNNGTATFGDIVDLGTATITHDLTPHDCSPTPLDAAVVDAPEL